MSPNHPTQKSPSNPGTAPLNSNQGGTKPRGGQGGQNPKSLSSSSGKNLASKLPGKNGKTRPESKTLYCRKALRDLQDYSWRNGVRRLSFAQLKRIRSANQWDDFQDTFNQQDHSDAPLKAGELNWAGTFTEKDAEILKKDPDQYLLQASAGLVQNGLGGRHQYRKPKTLGQSLKRMIAAFGWQSFLDEADLRLNWAHIVGESVAQHVKIESIYQNQITIRCDSTRWATELRMLIPQLMKAVHQQYPGITVEKMIVRGPNAPSWQHGTRSVSGRGPRDTYG